MTDKTTAEILYDAAKYIGEHGWCQGQLSDSDGNVCAIGAINRVAESDTAADTYDAIEALRDYLNLPEHAITLHPVARWNDEPGRSAEDVILAMKCAAKEVDEL
jgi:hypothetical protein